MIILWIVSLVYPIFCLNLNERNELSRKFKYYFSSVRPTAPENYVTNQNGTYFHLETELHVLSTVTKERSLHVDAVVSFTWWEDRLLLRELSQRLEMPDEFVPWLPRARTTPPPHSQSIFLSPSTGQVSWYHRIKSIIQCQSAKWKHPFENFNCELIVENIGDEILTVSSLRDLRPTTQFDTVAVQIAKFPSSGLNFSFDGEWQSAILSIYLPSFIVIFLVFFAQWKRRKVQVLVSTAALLCILVMLSGSRPYSRATLLDLWLSGCFLHVAFLLAVDLTLPARRVRYTLAVPVDRPEKAPLRILTTANMRSNRFVATLEKFAEKTINRLRDDSVTSELVTACPYQTPLQRHVTTATLGERKRLALLVIASSYILFMTIYVLLVFAIND